MGRINRGRVVLGGVLAGIVGGVGDALHGLLMRSEWEAAMKNLKPPGPATALRAGFAVWLFVHATFSLAAGAMDLLPARLMLVSAAWSLPVTLAATLAGARVYREP